MLQGINWPPSGATDILLCDRRPHNEEGLLQQFSYDSLRKETDQYR